MDALSKLCAKLDYHIARARLWKRAAKSWRRAWEELEKALKHTAGKYRDAQADADRLREMLRRCQDLLELSEKYVPGDLFYRDDLHDELAKELADD